MQQAIKQIMAQIFEIDPANIDDTSSPETVERWDSLKHMQLIMALEDEFGIEFPEEAIPELIQYDRIEKTVKQLSNS